MTLNEIRKLRHGREEKFDRRLFGVLLRQERDLIRPVFMDPEIWECGASRHRIRRGDDAAPYILAVRVKADVAMTVLYGELVSEGLKTIENAFGGNALEARRAYLKYRENLHRRFPNLSAVAHGWLSEAASELEAYRQHGPVAAMPVRGG